MLGVSQTGWFFVGAVTFLAFFMLAAVFTASAEVVLIGTVLVAPVVSFLIARFTPIMRVE